MEELKLYLITDSDILKGRDFYHCIEEALKGGVTMLQLREKEADGKEFLEKAISPELEKLIENKEVYTSRDNNEKALPITQNANTNTLNNSQVIYPIISDGDVIGSIVLLSKEQDTKMGDSELKVAQSAAGFLSSQMEI